MSVAKKIKNLPTSASALRKTYAISFPRSGHHLLVNCLTKYFSGQLDFDEYSGNNAPDEVVQANAFRYCEFYRHCRQTPCKDESVNFQKLHDFSLFKPFYQKAFTLRQEEIKIDNRKNYIVQFREHPIDAIVSEYTRSLKSALFFKSGVQDTDAFFSAFSADYLNYWKAFVDKWVLGLPKNAIAFSYEAFLQNPEETLTSIIRFLGEDHPDTSLISGIVKKLDIRPRSNIHDFKYYEPYLDQINEEAHEELHKKINQCDPRLKSRIRMQNQRSKSKSIMDKTELSLPVNDKMKASYEKSQIYEKALQSIEESLSSKIEIIRLKDQLIGKLDEELNAVKEDLKNAESRTANPAIEKNHEELLTKFNQLEQDHEHLKTAYSQISDLLDAEKQKARKAERKLAKKTKKLNALKSDEESLSEARQALADMVEKNETLTDSVAGYKTKIEKLESRISEESTSLNKQKSKAKKRKKEARKLKKLNKSLAQELASFREMHDKIISSVNAESAKLNSKLEELRDKKIQKDKETQNLRDQISTLEGYLDKRAQDLNLAESKLNDLTTELEDKNKTLEQQAKEASESKALILEMEESLLDKTEALEAIQKELGSAHAEREKQFETITALNQEKESIQKELARLKLDQQIQQGLLEKHEQDKRALDTQLQKLQHAGRIASELIKTSTHKIDVLEKQHNQQLNEVHLLRDRLQLSDQKMDQQSDLIKVLLKARNYLSGKTKNMQMEIELLQADKRQLKTALKSSDNQTLRLQASLKESKQKNDKLEDLIERSNLELYTRMKSINSLRSQLDALYDQLDHSKSHLIRSQSEVATLKSSYSWKIGWKVTRVIYTLFRWLPFIRKRL